MAQSLRGPGAVQDAFRAPPLVFRAAVRLAALVGRARCEERAELPLRVRAGDGGALAQVLGRDLSGARQSAFGVAGGPALAESPRQGHRISGGPLQLTG